MHVKQENFFIPALPTKPLPNLATRIGSPGGKFFFQKPHICVFEMINAARGLF